MRSVKSKGTNPEKKVESIIHDLGYKYRRGRAKIVGSADIYIPDLKIAIFVHGCFWHRHADCKEASMPASNVDYWSNKFEKNTIRDKENVYRTKRRGWRPVIVWECETKKPVLLKRRLDMLFKKSAVVLHRRSLKGKS